MKSQRRNSMRKRRKNSQKGGIFNSWFTTNASTTEEPAASTTEKPNTSTTEEPNTSTTKIKKFSSKEEFMKSFSNPITTRERNPNYIKEPKHLKDLLPPNRKKYMMSEHVLRDGQVENNDPTSYVGGYRKSKRRNRTSMNKSKNKRKNRRS